MFLEFIAAEYVRCVVAKEIKKAAFWNQIMKREALKCPEYSFFQRSGNALSVAVN